MENSDKNIVIPSVPSLDREFVYYKPEEVFEYINPVMLYNKHLGHTGIFQKKFEAGDAKTLKLNKAVEEIKMLVREEDAITPKGVYQYFSCTSDGDKINLFRRKSDEVIASLHFARQTKEPFLSATDYISSKERDVMALFIVTAGSKYLEFANKKKEEGRYLESHILHALALESAEATAELVHQRIRKEWGIYEEQSLKELHKAKYQGIRLSFGYPACPDLDQQQTLFDLLKPHEIDVTLTEEMMMVPECSVSALVFHHPKGEYFSI